MLCQPWVGRSPAVLTDATDVVAPASYSPLKQPHRRAASWSWTLKIGVGDGAQRLHSLDSLPQGFVAACDVPSYPNWCLMVGDLYPRGRLWGSGVLLCTVCVKLCFPSPDPLGDNNTCSAAWCIWPGLELGLGLFGNIESKILDYVHCRGMAYIVRIFNKIKMITSIQKNLTLLYYNECI